jgi:hypothetical protein
MIHVLQLQAASLAWGVHWFAAWLLLKGMNVPGVPWSELLAYTGYTFVPICFSVVGGCLAGTRTNRFTDVARSTFL